MIEWDVKQFAQLPSTQIYAKELAEEGLHEGLVVQALTQTKGHGRQGRQWQSPMGNLYMSFLLRPEKMKIDDIGQLAFVMGLSVSDAIDIHIEDGHDKRLKWPNDIFIDDKKCAGILIETSGVKNNYVDAIIVGMGVNVIAAPDDAIDVKAVCKESWLAVHPFRDDVLAAVNKRYENWINNGFDTIRNDWLSRAYKLDEEISVKQGNETLAGIFKDIDKTGALLLEDKAGHQHKINTGDIFTGA